MSASGASRREPTPLTLMRRLCDAGETQWVVMSHLHVQRRALPSAGNVRSSADATRRRERV